jgi:type VI secretion system protein ImpL
MKLLRAHSRWFIGAAIVLALAIVLWFVLPFVPAGDRHPFDSALARVLVVLLVIGAWLAIEAVRAWRLRRKGDQLARALAGDDAMAAETQESEKLRARFTEAMALLRGMRIGGTAGATALYALPWYMFIGAPGSGKTTALLKSGLRFPLAPAGEAAAALKGIGGTRNCDWWFTDEAVLIDTAGRYTTQDSRANVDEAGWRTFLGLLRRFRPRQPINGIFVTLSVEDLLASDPAARAAYAQAVRQRIEELQRHLGLEFPIYVLLTKVDLVCGFNEFFAPFDAPQRAQVWGMTFDFDLRTRASEGVRTGFDKEFPALVARLNELLFQRLQEERDAERRAVMYPFPQQFAALGPLVSEFLDRAFGESKLQGRAIVRGVYFTSATQEGAPIDRLIASLRRSLDLNGGRERAPAAQGAAKAFFITRLLEEVVFPEAALAGFSERREAMLRRLGWGLAAAGLVLSAGFVSAASWSYVRNRDALVAAAAATAQAREAVRGVGTGALEDLPAVLDALTRLRAVPAAIHVPVDDPPWAMRFGLYQGEEVDERVGTVYRDALQKGLLPRVALHLERIMTAPASGADDVYAALKSYLMLYEPKQMDAAWFSQSVASSLAATLPRESVPTAQAHLAALADIADLQAGEAHERDAGAIATARAKVAQLSVVDRAYAALRHTPVPDAREFRISEAVGPAGLGVLERRGASLADPVPAIFTRDGYRTAVRGRVAGVVADFAREEDWILGEKSSGFRRMRADQTVAEVLRRYFGDYTATWDGVLADTRVRPLAGLDDALAVGRVLAQADSPLRRLVAAVDEQTRLSEADGASAVAAAASVPLAAHAAAIASAALRGAALLDSPTHAGEVELERHFAGLHRLAGDGKSADVDAALQALLVVVTELSRLQTQAPAPGAQEVPEGLAAARGQADRFGSPVREAILALADVGVGTAKGGARREVKEGVGAASATCARAIPGAYPFARMSAQDLGLQEFTTVFRAGGELDAFFTSTLQRYVVKGATWKLKDAGDTPVSPATVRQFQNADAIRIAFFAGTASPSVTADVDVVSGDGELTLDYDGTPNRLRAGGPGARVTWPARPGARLSAGGQVIAAAEGPWALFRLVDKGTPEPGGGTDRVRVSYPVPGGSRVVLDVRTTSSTYNPFRLRELQAFACPRE